MGEIQEKVITVFIINRISLLFFFVEFILFAPKIFSKFNLRDILREWENTIVSYNHENSNTHRDSANIFNSQTRYAVEVTDGKTNSRRVITRNMFRGVP